jgi:glycosyltransferase involved in cell wall biosynthesis
MNNKSQIIQATMVTNMLPPYRASFYRETAKITPFTLVLDTLSEFNRNWKLTEDISGLTILVQNCRSFVYRRQRDDVGYEEKRQFHFSEKTILLLRESKPDVIVTIEYGFKTFWSLLYGMVFNVPVILASEGTIHTEGHVGWFKQLVRKCIVSQCSRFWSNGPDSTSLLVTYGADPNLVDEGMTGIDTSDWRFAVENCLSQRETFRGKWGLKGKVLLFSGSLTPRKGVVLLAKAVEQWVKEDGIQDVTLLLLGEGDERVWLESWSASHPDINLVMPGFVQHHELPQYYAAADWAVLPTVDDNWPLATLETLVAGLPQLFSKYNGATGDLCNSTTGLEFDPCNQEDFICALRYFSQSSMMRINEAVVDHFSTHFSARSQAERAVGSFCAALNQRYH